MDDVERTWSKLFEAEVTARAEVDATIGDGGERARTAARAWWATVEAALKHYALAATRGVELSPPPLELMIVLANNVAGNLAAGIVPPFVGKVAGRGARGTGPSERRDIGWATAYIQAAKAGVISDPHPIKSVAEAYGAHRHTVQRWAKLPLPVEIERHANAGELIEGRMRKAASAYRIASRSVNALIVRAQ